MWKLYSIGFGLMAAVMIALGVILFIVTLIDPGKGGSAPEWVLLVRALAAVVLGAIAAMLAVAAWRQAQRPQV
jgi:multisubunit Na+/H+ antiporter MnhB subunit